MVLSVAWLEQILAYATPAVAAIAAYRLWSNKLIARYRYFFAYLILNVVEYAVFFSLDRRSPAQFYVFVIDEPIRWILQICVLLELYALIVKEYAGIAATARRYVRIALVLAILATLAIAVLNHESGPGKFPVTETFFLLSRVVMLGIVTFLGLLVLFLAWFPIPLNRNVLIYLFGYSVYFITRAVVFFLGNALGSDWYRPLSVILTAVNVGCMALWAVWLSLAGEAVDVKMRHRSPNEERHLIDQLETLNATLLRRSR